MKKRTNHFIVFTLLLIATLLTSCWLPEKFNAEIDINKDGSYTLIYDGILTFVMAKAAEIEQGKLSAKDEKDLKDLEKEFKEDKNFKKVKYLGHAQFKVLYEQKGTLNSPVYFLGKDMRILSIIPSSNNTVEIKGMKLDKSDIQQLNELKMKIDGELEVSTDAKILKHNAKSSPKFFGGYKWKIKSIDDPAPYMTLELAEQSSIKKAQDKASTVISEYIDGYLKNDFTTVINYDRGLSSQVKSKVSRSPKFLQDEEKRKASGEQIDRLNLIEKSKKETGKEFVNHLNINEGGGGMLFWVLYPNMKYKIREIRDLSGQIAQWEGIVKMAHLEVSYSDPQNAPRNGSQRIKNAIVEVYLSKWESDDSSKVGYSVDHYRPTDYNKEYFKSTDSKKVTSTKNKNKQTPKVTTNKSKVLQQEKDHNLSSPHSINLNSKYYTDENPYYDGYNGQCTHFAWGRAYEITGIKLSFQGRSYPKAKDWFIKKPVDSLNLELGSQIQANSIAVWKGDYLNPNGHVAYVEKVANGVVYYNEANVTNYKDGNFGGGYHGKEENKPIKDFENRGKGVGNILGYIYLTQTPKSASNTQAQGTKPQTLDQAVEETVEKAVDGIFKGLFGK